MKFTVEYNPDFFDDILQAVDWYNEKQAGLGDRFFNVEALFHTGRNPAIWNIRTRF